MVTIGLTGGIASGKSTVSAEFGKLGALIIDADQIARELIRPHKRAWRKIIAAFGREIQSDDLTIDREKLAAKVFSDEVHRETLNRIMHPEIRREIQSRRERIEGEDPDALVIVDAALLVETGFYREMDKLIVVSVSEENQIRRLVDRSGLSVEEAKRRIGAQMAPDEKLKHADYVINTDGPLAEIRKQVSGIYGELMATKEREPVPDAVPLSQSRTRGGRE